MTRILILALTALTVSSVAAAQTPTPPQANAQCDDLVTAIAMASDAKQRAIAATTLANMNLHPSCLANTLLLGAEQRRTFASVLKQLESRRTDKQSGTSVGTGGTTSLVSKGTTAKVLSFAAEY